MKERKHHTILFVSAMLAAGLGNAMAQETVFGLFRKEVKMADEYMAEKRFADALDIYLQEASADAPTRISGKIARCYYWLRQYDKAVEWYGLQAAESMGVMDIFYHAEALASLKQYDKAIEWYRKYLAKKPADPFVIKKIWQLQNVHYLYEDSLHYVLRETGLNSDYGELCATPYGNGLVFLSNRRQIQVIDKIDAASRSPFYRLYESALVPDTVNHIGFVYGKPIQFKKSFSSRFHDGPVRFFNREKSMVYVSNSDEAGEGGVRTLQLFFADRTDGKWKTTAAFPYNSTDYSLSDPAISEDGSILYFSSDMKGGFGGKDLYRSERVENEWTKPVNLGDHINTPFDEVFPYLHQNNMLYFSSNGHAGLGGLDIFRTPVTGFGFGEVTNMGFPVNSHGDEFGIIMDSLSTHGYITSNRKQSGYDDDILEFDMDVQTYPLVISGFLRSKQFSWSDSSSLETLANAKLYLVDNLRNIMVYENQSDSTGYFSLQVPYFSQYKIRVVGNDNQENIVSLEIPKHRKAEGKHEIVVVKDPFRQQYIDVLR